MLLLKPSRLTRLSISTTPSASLFMLGAHLLPQPRYFCIPVSNSHTPAKPVVTVAFSSSHPLLAPIVNDRRHLLILSSLRSRPTCTMPPPSTSDRRILSIQSHVTSGYVGNKAAVFPLQLLGYDVDVLNSCMLANHTGYKNGASGLRLSGNDLKLIITGMTQNALLSSITHVLTGYIGTVSFLHAVVDAIESLRVSRPNLVYVCDPVLGDNGKLYVPNELIAVYTERVLPYATIVTPNAFELGLLTDRKISSEADAFAACDVLHSRTGVPVIFVTGTRFSSDDHTLSVLVSARGAGEETERVAVDAAILQGTFTGSGDLLSALLLAWMDRMPDDAVAACCHAMASVSAVLRRTIDMPRSVGNSPFPELRLIQSQKDIVNPPLELVKTRVVKLIDKNDNNADS